MPIALWCLLIAALLPILSALPAKFSKDFDNANPRNPDYWKDGFRARAQAAQANGFEAFPFFCRVCFCWLGSGRIGPLDRPACGAIHPASIDLRVLLLDQPGPTALNGLVCGFPDLRRHIHQSVVELIRNTPENNADFLAR